MAGAPGTDKHPSAASPSAALPTDIDSREVRWRGPTTIVGAVAVDGRWSRQDWPWRSKSEAARTDFDRHQGRAVPLAVHDADSSGWNKSKKSSRKARTQHTLRPAPRSQLGPPRAPQQVCRLLRSIGRPPTQTTACAVQTLPSYDSCLSPLPSRRRPTASPCRYPTKTHSDGGGAPPLTVPRCPISFPPPPPPLPN